MALSLASELLSIAGRKALNHLAAEDTGREGIQPQEQNHREPPSHWIEPIRVLDVHHE